MIDKPFISSPCQRGANGDDEAHDANARQRPIIEAICEASGYRSPVICTPEELLGDHYVD
jgi:hypothetical protein